MALAVRLAGAVLAVSPFVFGFSDEGTNAWLPHVIAGVGLMFTQQGEQLLAKLVLKGRKPTARELQVFQPAWDKVWDSDPFYTSGDAAFPALRKITQQPLPIQTTSGNAFPQTASPGQQAAVAAYVLTDMMQQVVQGTAAPAAVTEAHNRMVQIFEQQGLKQ